MRRRLNSFVGFLVIGTVFAAGVPEQAIYFDCWIKGFLRLEVGNHRPRTLKGIKQAEMDAKEKKG